MSFSTCTFQYLVRCARKASNGESRETERQERMGFPQPDDNNCNSHRKPNSSCGCLQLVLLDSRAISHLVLCSFKPKGTRLSGVHV